MPVALPAIATGTIEAGGSGLQTHALTCVVPVAVRAATSLRPSLRPLLLLLWLLPWDHMHKRKTSIEMRSR